jgi:hypothetical protein
MAPTERIIPTLLEHDSSFALVPGRVPAMAPGATHGPSLSRSGTASRPTCVGPPIGTQTAKQGRPVRRRSRRWTRTVPDAKFQIRRAALQWTAIICVHLRNLRLKILFLCPLLPVMLSTGRRFRYVGGHEIRRERPFVPTVGAAHGSSSQRLGISRE